MVYKGNNCPGFSPLVDIWLLKEWLVFKCKFQFKLNKGALLDFIRMYLKGGLFYLIDEK